MRRTVRFLLAMGLCPALGAMVGRGIVSRLIEGTAGETTGWIAGFAVGLAYGVGLARLSLSPLGSHGRATGDLVLVALSAIALADVLSQLARVSLDWLWPSALVVFFTGLVVVLRSLYRRAYTI